MDLYRTKRLLLLLVVLSVFCTSGESRRKKQVGTGVTFAFPGLNLLGGGFNNNNNNGGGAGNFFGGQTFTRTLVSTVSTVTTASFRTCTMPVAALMPCAGRRRRDVENVEDELANLVLATDDVRLQAIEPTASIALIIGTTTLTDPLAVSEYLVAHEPSTNSIIYPQDVVISEVESLPQSSFIDDENVILDDQPATTALYPSNDSPDAAQEVNFDDVPMTTERPVFDDQREDNEATTPKLSENILEDQQDAKARVGLGKTTVTTIIRVTSVATTIATGTMATLTVVYSGCLPQSLPVSGLACV